MSNYKEELLSKIKVELSDEGYDYNQIRTISNVVALALNDYDLAEKCTDVATIDTSSQAIAKLFLSTLLTEGKSHKTVEAYANTLNMFINEVAKPVTEVGVFDIRVWLAKRQQSASLRTCENYRAYLSSFYNWMHREEIIQSNPMSKIKPIKYTEDAKQPFSQVDIDKLRNACKSTRDRAIIELLLSSGLRASELSDLNRNDIDFDSSQINVRNGKGGKQRYTYMSDLCKEYLRKYLSDRKDDSEWLFGTNYKTRMSVDTLESIIRRIGKRAGVENTHPHRFRRTFATTFAKREMDVRSIQMLMGHSSVETTMHYVSLSDEQVKLNYQKYAV